MHVPEQLASSLPLQGLCLELWSASALISTSTVVVLPASLPALAAEVQALQAQQAKGRVPGVAEFLADAAEFVEDCGRGGGGDGGEMEGEGGVREGGCGLVRQAVSWGLPGLATLLMGCLMALPSCGSDTTTARFARLFAVDPSSAGRSAAAAAVAAAAAADGGSRAEGSDEQQEQGGCSPSLEQLGGLLHLALRSPNPGVMLQAVLGWGRRDGSGGGLGFAWGERASVEATLPCIPGSHPALAADAATSKPAQGQQGKGGAGALVVREREQHVNMQVSRLDVGDVGDAQCGVHLMLGFASFLVA